MVPVMRVALWGFAAANVALLALTLAGMGTLPVIMAFLFVGNAFMGLVMPATFVMALEEHGDIAGPEVCSGLECRMGRAEAFVLFDTGMRGGELAHCVHFGADHHDDPVEHRLAGCQQVAQHWPAGDRVQGFRHGRLHPRAETGRQHDGRCWKGRGGYGDHHRLK